MAVTGLMQLSLDFGICRNHGRSKRLRLNFRTRDQLHLVGSNLLSVSPKQCSWSRNSKKMLKRVSNFPCESHMFKCHCSLNPGPSLDTTFVKNVALNLAGSFKNCQGSPMIVKLASAIGIVIFTIWGLQPVVRLSRNIVLNKSDSSWKKSSIYHVTTSYIQPLFLWAGAIFICRILDPMVLPTAAGQLIKQRLLNFVRSLSTVLAFAYCLSSIIQQAQKFMETNDAADTRNMGFQYAGKALYTAVWVAAVSLFMELLGFSTQKWLTAGGLGTVLLTLAGREIFTNFLSSAMIHATRPFVVNEWIQTKIEGYEVSGTVEHVGWWSPTIVRGEDRDAIHIPNHKFTVNVVRNLSQKTHWRIKTHLAISHLDVGKISNIVADMRKVLAKNPQVEQQKLHRRVFFDYINPENQALLILVSCFVKTSRFEEYLCVKEAIFQDLLRVIRHHRARLATPIRTVQKVYTDTELDNVPHADSTFNRGAAVGNRPLLLIEPSYKINGEDKTKSPQARTTRINGEEGSKATARSTPDDKVDAQGKSTLNSYSKSREAMPPDSKEHEPLKEDVKPVTKETSKADAKENPKVVEKSLSDPRLNNSIASNSASKADMKASEVSSSNSSDPPGLTQNTLNTKQPLRVGQEHNSTSSPESSGDKRLLSSVSQLKQDTRQVVVTQPSTSKHSLEENIVLGVALEGSKRTLPIEEDTVPQPNPEDIKELTACRTGNVAAVTEKENNDIKRSKNPGSSTGDQLDMQA